jgi:hypothetical protein
VSPRFTETKLKAFLIIDLLLFASITGTYFYLQNEGLVASGSKPAEFKVTDLIINPLEAEVYEPITITANVTNIGNEPGNYMGNLTINNALEDNQTVLVDGGNSTLLEFIVVEQLEGTYTAEIGGLTGNFTITAPSITSSNITLDKIMLPPYESWASPFESWVNEPITVLFTATNTGSETESLSLRLMIDDSLADAKRITLAAGESTEEGFTFNSTIEGRHTIKVGNLTGTFLIVPTGYHTLTIARTGGGSTPVTFTVNGVEYKTKMSELLPVGEYRIDMPNPFTTETAVFEFDSWADGVTSPSRTVNLDKRTTLVVAYTLVSGWASCPSLYIWNGTCYVYVSEVSNSGWLGDISHIDANGEIIFAGGNPWDYVKLDKNNLNPTADGYFDMVLTQQWDELFYFDSAYMIVVDHPADVEVLATMSNYINNVFNDQIYTINETSLLSPVNATYVWAPKGTNEEGINVLPQISQLDGVFTPGNSGVYSQAWNNISLNQLTIDLGNLSGAEQIKLVVNGMADWGDPAPYYPWIESFETAAAQGLIEDGTEISPAPYMEVKDASGNWVKPPKEKQIPLPGDYVPRTFAVDITDLFQPGTTDFEIRIYNFWNITWNYIGIDLSPQQNITVQKIKPEATLAPVDFGGTKSNSSGNFTRYGDVTALIQNADEMYVIGRQGDQIHLLFPTDNLTAPAEGMVRDYFLVTTCFYKDEPGEWGYGFEFTVNPLPFRGMSGYPYLPTESYPYDAVHLAYLKEYNTRIIPSP